MEVSPEARRAGSTLRLRVRAHLDGGRLRVEVANTGSLRARADGSTGISLRNVRERLATLFPGRHGFQLVEEGQVVARLWMEEAHAQPRLVMSRRFATRLRERPG